MNFLSISRTLKSVSALIALLLVLLFGIASSKILFAQTVETETTATPMKIYLPVVNNGASNSPTTKTPTPMPPPPTQTPTQTPTPIVTVTPVTPQPPITLPAQLVGTWFTGNAPLNDFYDPTTGEWRAVNGIGQMYVFAGNGAYTYTAFARFQTGACQSEVSVFKQGIAQTAGDALTLKANQSKTRTVTICPTPNESITEGSQDPVTIGWSVAANDSGIIIFTTSEQGAEGTVHTEFKKVGMAESLIGMWHTAALTPDGFYDPTTKTFNADSADGIWYEFAADATYRYGEHGFSYPNAEGCILEGWVYQTGTINVIGGSITIEPKDGVLQLVNSCGGDLVITNPWVPEANNFAWQHSDLSGDIKLVMIQLMPFKEYIFKR